MSTFRHAPPRARLRGSLVALLLGVSALLPAQALAASDPIGFFDPAVEVRAVEVEGDPRLSLLAAPGPAEEIARDLAGELAADWARIEAILGHRDPAPLEVRVAYGKSSFASLQPPAARVPGWAAGVAFSGLGVIVLDAQASGRGGSVRAVLQHELAHIALGRLVEGRVPRWFNEGFALQVAGEWSPTRSGVVARAVMARALIPLSDLDESWPHSPTDVNLAYAQSASMVGHLLGVEGGDALRRLVTHLQEGLPFPQALQAAYGKPLIALESEWKDGLRLRYGWLTLLMDTELLWAAAALVLVFGAFAKWRRKRKRLAQMELEEAEEVAWVEQVERALEAKELEEAQGATEEELFPTPPKDRLLH